MLLKTLIFFFLITQINSTNINKDQRIIIIGAGSSGIAAASKLFANHFTNVKILEAENRIGGRINTINFGENFIELGAQWCHGEVNNIVYELAEPFDLLEPSIITENATNFIKTDGTLVDDQSTDAQLEFLSGVTSSDAFKNYDGTIGSFITTEYDKITQINGVSEDDKNEFLRFFENFICDWSAASNWNELSGKGYSLSENLEGVLYLSWKHNGYKTILDVLMNKYSTTENPYPMEENIFLENKVNKIIWDGEEIIVETEENNIYYADKVVVTVSLGVLKANHQTLFSPRLPEEKVFIIDSLDFGVVDKIYIEYEQPWWPRDFIGYDVLWKKEDIANLEDDEQWLLSILAVYPVDYQPKVLNVLLSGHYVKDFELLSEEQYIAGIYKLFTLIFNEEVADLQPVNMLRTTWHLRENFYGSYSFLGLTADRNNITGADLATPLKNSLGEDSVYFAGEATHEKYFATVHGAIETGFREAQKIIDLCN